MISQLNGPSQPNGYSIFDNALVSWPLNPFVSSVHAVHFRVFALNSVFALPRLNALDYHRTFALLEISSIRVTSSDLQPGHVKNTANLLPLPVMMIVALGLIRTGPVPAQTLEDIYTFSAGSPVNATNRDGASPYGSLILSGNTLYGTAEGGGDWRQGSVFRVNTDGTDFTNLHSFAALGPFNSTTNAEGAQPYAGLVLSGATLYGTAYGGGTNGSGTVFAVNTDGTGFTNLHNFAALGGGGINSDGANPQAGLILSGSTLFGTASLGGTNGRGTVFRVNVDGTGFTNLYSFTTLNNSTNSDGVQPYSRLLLSGNTLYGTAEAGGTSGNGTVFAVNTDGTGFTNLHNFAGNDGQIPYAGLILSGSNLYGAAEIGGSFGNGTVFAISTNGTDFTNLHSFAISEGSQLLGDLILSGRTLYGTAASGGTGPGFGTVFAVNADTTGFTNLHSFTRNDGANPLASLILSSNTLYGTTSFGGSYGNGTVFSLTFLPQLTITPSDANVVLTWPTNVAGFSYAGFALQSTTNLASPSDWAPVSPTPIVLDGQNTVTNPISGARQFYRLTK